MTPLIALAYAVPFVFALYSCLRRKTRVSVAVLLGMCLSVSVVEQEPAPWDIAAAVWLGIVAVEVLRCGRLYTHKPYLVLCAVFILLNIMLASCWYASGYASNRGGASLAVYTLTTIGLCVTSLGIVPTCQQPGVRMHLLDCVVAGCAIGAMVGLLQYAQSTGRIRGMCKDPNVYAALMAAGLLLVICRWLVLRNGGIVCALASVVFSAALLASVSRGAVINVCAGLLFVCVAYKKKARAVMGVLVAATMIVVAADRMDIADDIRERFQTRDSASEQWRVVALHEGLQLLKQYPYGIGPGQFENRVSIISATAGELPLASHNTIMRVATELGLEGLVGWVLLAWIPLGQCWQGRNSSDVETRYVALGTGAVIVGCLVQGLVLDVLHWRHLWILLGLAITLRSRRNSSAYDRSERSRNHSHACAQLRVGA